MSDQKYQFPKKRHSTTLTFLGIKLDSLAFEARLPLDKPTKCQTLIGETLNKKKAILKQLQQITVSHKLASSVLQSFGANENVLVQKSLLGIKN